MPRQSQVWFTEIGSRLAKVGFGSTFPATPAEQQDEIEQLLQRIAERRVVSGKVIHPGVGRLYYYSMWGPNARHDSALFDTVASEISSETKRPGYVTYRSATTEHAERLP